MNEGGKYQSLKEVIFLAIANFTMFPDKEAYKSDHMILDKETYDNDLKDFSFTFLELGKFEKTKNQLSSMMDKWGYFFKHAPETTPDELQAVIGQDTIIQRAYEELDRFYWSEEELRTYEKEVKRVMDNQAVLDEQIYQAKIKGIEQGKAEEKTEIAKAMLKEGIPIETIMKITGLEEDVISQSSQ